MKQRYYSLDVFRGATVAFMILVNNPGDWNHSFSPLKHARWHGCTPTDLVFPFFLFAVGNALAFVLPRIGSAGTNAFLAKIIKRTLLIFFIGLLLNWSPFIQWDGNSLAWKPWVDASNPDRGVRILGVLQRIALSYCFAALILYFFKVRGAFIASAIILIGYWAICLLLGNPTDPYSMDGFFGTAIDKSVLGVAHMYKGEGVPFDPEGLMSTLPAIVQVLFGYFAGSYIVAKGNNYKMLANIFVAGAVLIFAGFCWDLVFPINKKIWTSSYVLYTSGLAMMVLGILVYLLEFRNAAGRWSRFFDVFGKNPLFIFVLSGFIPRFLGLFRFADHVSPEGKTIYTSPLPWLYEHLCKPISENLKIGSLVYALILIAAYWAICYWLDKRKIYIKV